MINTNIKRGYLAALISSLSYGMVAVVTKKVVSDMVSPLTAAAFGLFFGTLIMSLLLNRRAYIDLKKAPLSAILLMGLAGLAGLWGVIFFHVALYNWPVALVTSVSGTYPLMAIVISHFFLKRLERVTLRNVSGAVLVVSGVILIAFGYET